MMRKSFYAWYVVILLSVTNLVSYLDRMALATLAPYVKSDLSLSDSQLGLLIGLAFAFFYATCAIPIARFADKASRRNIIAASLAIWSVFTLLCGLAQNFFQLFLARMGVGAGEAGASPASQSVICDYVEEKQRPLAFAFFALGPVLGLFLGISLVGWLAETFGWRSAFFIIAAPGLVLALLTWASLKEPQREAPPKGIWDSIDGSQQRDSLFKSSTFRYMTAYFTVTGFASGGLTQWWPSFYVRSFDVPPVEVSFYLGVALGLGAGIGLIVGGLLSNRLALRNRRLPLYMGAIANAFVWPIGAVSILSPSFSLSIICVGIFGVFSSIPNGAVYSALHSSTEPTARATAAAIVMFFQAAIGISLGPACVGLISDWLAPTFGVGALKYALLVPLTVLLLHIPLLILIARSIRAKSDRVGQNEGIQNV